jgi:hypothetical protein
MISRQTEDIADQQKEKDRVRKGLIWILVESAMQLYRHNPGLLDRKLGGWFKDESLLPEANEHVPEVNIDIFKDLGEERTMTVLRLIEILRHGANEASERGELKN